MCILGRQSAFGLAELESRFGGEAIRPIGTIAAMVDIADETTPFHLLGSIIKYAEPLFTVDSLQWSTIFQSCREKLPSLLPNTEGKLKIGLSAYDLQVSSKMLQRAGLELKKSLRNLGYSVRIVPNTAPALNSAQIRYNRLTTDHGLELVFVADGDRTHVARTRYVQDVDDYAARDFGRPKRDAFVGMLPPKLAQTMLNLTQIKPTQTLLDPFCGTGVLLQEAALMGCSVYGSDISKRMIEYATQNLQWLSERYHMDFSIKLETLDATTARWQAPIDALACETYLGRPLTLLPAMNELQPIMDECNDITSRFLTNIHSQLKAGTRCCIAIPAWFDGKNFIHLKLVDYLEKIGYNRVSFKHVNTEQLVYHRTDQTVARELLVLTVKELS